MKIAVGGLPGGTHYAGPQQGNKQGGEAADGHPGEALVPGDLCSGHWHNIIAMPRFDGSDGLAEFDGAGEGFAGRLIVGKASFELLAVGIFELAGGVTEGQPVEVAYVVIGHLSVASGRLSVAS